MKRLCSAVCKVWLVVIIVLIVSSGTYTQELRTSRGINLECNHQTLRSVLEEVRSQAGVNIVFDDNLIDDLEVSCKIENGAAESTIKYLLKDFDIDYRKFNEKSFVLFKKEKPDIKSFTTTVLEQQPVFSVDTNVVIVRPVKVSEGIPVYPPEAVRNKIEGKVSVKIYIDVNGDVTKSLVEKSSGYRILDSAAVNYTRGLKFIPATAKDKPVSVWISIVFEYRISNIN